MQFNILKSVAFLTDSAACYIYYCLSCSFHFVPVDSKPYGYLVGKELVILLFECVVGKYLLCFVCFLSHPLSMLGL